MANETNDRRLINGVDDVVKLNPLKYQWAWTYYNAANANHWLPQEVNMQKDIEQWKAPGVLTDNEKNIVETALGFFTTADSLVANNLVLGVYARLTAPEARMYLLRQAFEEAIHCYAEGTEILTPRGFKEFKDLLPGEEVAQYHEDGSITFVVPDEAITDSYKGDMVQFKNHGTYNKIVTPNHRCVTFNERMQNKIEITKAEKLSPCNRRFPVAGNAVGLDELTDFQRLQIAYQADGGLLNKGFDNGAITGKIGYVFRFKKARKIERMQELLTRGGWDYTRTERGGYTHFYVRIDKNTPLLKDFTWVDFSAVSSVWCSSFLDETVNWDGSIRAKGFVYTTTNKLNRDVVQTLAHLCGKRAGLYLCGASGARQESYQVHISNKPYVSGKSIEKWSIPYDGKVYCVGVPTGMIVVKYDGNIMVSGNTHSYQHIVESLGLDDARIFDMYRSVEAIYNKDNFVGGLAHGIRSLDDSEFLESLIDFYVIMEGIFFYSSFAAIMAFKRRNLLPGVVEQFEWIMRDESMHLNFGVDLINGIISENPELWTVEFKAKIRLKLLQAAALEEEYARTLIGNGMLGLTVQGFSDYTKYITDRRLESIGLGAEWKAKNPFPWMSAATDLVKEKNFFETRVTEYQTGGALEWE